MLPLRCRAVPAQGRACPGSSRGLAWVWARCWEDPVPPPQPQAWSPARPEILWALSRGHRTEMLTFPQGRPPVQGSGGGAGGGSCVPRASPCGPDLGVLADLRTSFPSCPGLPCVLWQVAQASESRTSGPEPGAPIPEGSDRSSRPELRAPRCLPTLSSLLSLGVPGCTKCPPPTAADQACRCWEGVSLGGTPSRGGGHLSTRVLPCSRRNGAPASAAGS